MDKERIENRTDTTALRESEAPNANIGLNAIPLENLDTVSGGPMFTVNTQRIDPYK